MARLSGLFRLGQDAEVKTGKDGDFIAMSLAYGYRAGDKDETQWVSVTMDSKRSGAVPHLKKGTAIEGLVVNLHAETYTNRDGVVVPTLRGRLIDFEFAGGGGGKSEVGDE